MSIQMTREATTKLTEADGQVRFSGASKVRLAGLSKLITKQLHIPAATAAAAVPPAPAVVTPATENIGLELFSAAGGPADGVLVEYSADCVAVVDFSDGYGPRRLPLRRPGPVGAVGRLELDGSPTRLVLENHNPGAEVVVTVAVWGGRAD